MASNHPSYGAAQPPPYEAAAAHAPLLGAHHDVEAGTAAALRPDKPVAFDCEADIRSAFVAKVFAIVTAQLLLTAALSLFLTLYRPATLFMATHPGMLLAAAILSIVVLIALMFARHRYPWNFALLAVFTLCEAWLVGAICASYSARSVAAAVAVTAAMIGVLAALAAYAARQGKDLSGLGAACGMALIGLCVVALINVFVPFGGVMETVYCLAGAAIFSGLVAFDVWRLLTVYPPDEYVAASVDLYLDVINLFIFVLRLIGDRDN